MSKFSDIRANMELTNAQFLLTELDLARTFLQLSETTQDRETMRRNRRHARLAYETVRKFLPRVFLTGDDREEVETGLALLKQRLGDED